MLRRPATQIALTQEDLARYEESRAQQQAEKAAARERKVRELGVNRSPAPKNQFQTQNAALGDSPTEESSVDEAVVHESRYIDPHESHSRTAQMLPAQQQQQRHARADASGSPSGGNVSVAGTLGASRARPVTGRARHMRAISSSRGGRAAAQTNDASDRADAADEARQRAAQRRARILGRGAAPASGSLG